MDVRDFELGLGKSGHDGQQAEQSDSDSPILFHISTSKDINDTGNAQIEIPAKHMQEQQQLPSPAGNFHLDPVL